MDNVYFVSKTGAKVEMSVVNEIIDSYKKKTREELLDGKKVELEGIGVLTPHFRKVKNPMGRDYSIKVVLNNDNNFMESLVSGLSKDPSKFENYMSKDLRQNFGIKEGD